MGPLFENFPLIGFFAHLAETELKLDVTAFEICLKRDKKPPFSWRAPVMVLISPFVSNNLRARSSA